MTSVNDIRSSFLSYFARNGHEEVASSPLVPRNDPTLMFTNAGMVQFKNVFTGVEKRDYVRATTSQKCVRAGGKHNDLDNVGFTARHHTFFEMLGNFSFGDYFKEHAIELAWNLLTKEWGLPKEKLTATIYEDDDEAMALWKKIAGLPEDRIVRLGAKSNFWQMGDTGPCGPCSEIFYDHGDKYWGGPPGSPEEDGDRFVEIWNLVFMQFEQFADGSRTSLPKPSVDTGSGLERVAAVMQGTNNNYEIDLFKSLVSSTMHATNFNGDPTTPSLRVISDHVRAMSFLIAEGVLPSNEGRGYVLRRIMRRAMRHATLLGATDPVIHKIVPTLVKEMGQAYPELVRGEQMIEETVRLEEQRFLKTLSRGLVILDDATAGLKEGDMLEGVTAFKLYDTYGFPLDLTQDALRTRGINVDLSGFEDAMARQRAEARKSWAGSGEASEDKVWFAVADQVGPTEFLGYETETAEGAVTALVKGGAMVDALKAGDEGYVVLNQTPFYGESGGQVGDTGSLSGEGIAATVTDTVKNNGVFGHKVKVTEGAITVGSPLALLVDHDRRSAIRANHSATHLLHEALRLVLGDHVAQKGSMVSADRLRFDFVHTKPITPQELAQVEEIANDIVLQNSPVETRLMGVEEAKESGARALFGEKYGDEVRVVSMGDPTGNAVGWSVELCGGTHVRRTGDIGLITVLGDSGVAAGVRRIEALTAKGARQHARTNANLVAGVADALHVGTQEVFTRIEALQENLKKAERALSDANKKLALGGGGSAPASADETVNGVTYVGRAVEGISAKDVKGLVDSEKKRIGSGVVTVVLKGEDGRGTVAVGVTDDLTGKYSAGELIKLATAALGGQGGGGRPDMAQGGGPDGAKGTEAIAAVRGGL
ncbi:MULTISPECIES: alanine--tRNA ligase [unclassified Devosia]|uniref:alanine--tRNA ligase n=1 Tax=unclassified Devosia TaxID=196773 RepID=UPI00086E3B27|nr:MULTISPECIES: alanine--tRNA ligase [unclassified Devosia]MBN9361851.1 alanine--tRNA ligase [Devosia sp.]ODS83967.1 MAG: alanine--tRNA ligase [Devosia sp. SCN 66-27]OJX26867.1 MAG: alanine--tRNA ligase [Devosia sp. 66-14]